MYRQRGFPCRYRRKRRIPAIYGRKPRFGSAAREIIAASPAASPALSSLSSAIVWSRFTVRNQIVTPPALVSPPSAHKFRRKRFDHRSGSIRTTVGKTLRRKPHDAFTTSEPIDEAPWWPPPKARSPTLRDPAGSRQSHFRSGSRGGADLARLALRRPCASRWRSGLAKTKLVTTLGSCWAGCGPRAVHPDLIPPISSAPKSWIRTRRESGPSVHPGPIFTQLLMADEINRASPRTQSRCCRPCRNITLGCRQALDLPRPFHVLATQNPLEQEGTYPLPKHSSTAS